MWYSKAEASFTILEESSGTGTCHSNFERLYRQSCIPVHRFANHLQGLSKSSLLLVPMESAGVMWIVAPPLLDFAASWIKAQLRRTSLLAHLSHLEWGLSLISSRQLAWSLHLHLLLPASFLTFLPNAHSVCCSVTKISLWSEEVLNAFHKVRSKLRELLLL